MKKKLLIGLLVLGLIGLGSAAYFHYEPVVQAEEDMNNESKKDTETVKEEEKKYGMKQNYYAPRFTLENMSGEEMTLEDFEGKFVLLNFWATWCKYCVKEMPDFQRFHEENQEDFAVVGIDVGEGKQVVQNFLEQHQITYTNLLDKDRKVAQQYQVSAYPTTYILSREGKLLYMVRGMVNYETLNKVKKT